VAVTTTLAIYEALIEAKVPPPAARRAAEALEADMTQHLATKQDLAHWGEIVSQRIDSLDTRLTQRIDSLEARIDARFVASAAEYDLKLQTLESRIVVKLGALMAFLFALAGSALALSR